MYASLSSAAKGLLGEATLIASKCGKKFAVCGGWSPFLRNADRFGHPGTRDVDLLFSDGADKENLKEVVSAFLQHGYGMRHWALDDAVTYLFLKNDVSMIADKISRRFCQSVWQSNGDSFIGDEVLF